jgi:peptide/nickel transport system substrate-binding protein
MSIQIGKQHEMRKQALGLLCVWMLILTGCSPEAAKTTTPESAPLRIGTPMHIRQANLLADYGYNILAMLATHDTLVRFDPAMNPYPQLAQSWHASPDGLEWQFHIRPDARWHDGEPVTAADVQFTFEYLGDHHPASGWIKDLVREIRVEGQTVSFSLVKPYSLFLINGGFIVRVLPQHIWRNVADPLQPGDAAVTVGCGPFIFDGLDSRGARIAFRRNDGYYGSPPSVNRLEFLLGQTFDVMTLSLLRGDIDLFYKYASGFSPPHLPRLAENSNIRLQQCDSMGIPAALGFNLKSLPMSSLDFRKALALALDYEKIARSLLGASGKTPTGGFIPPAFSYCLEMPPLSPTPEESRRLLDATGFTDSDNDGIRNLPGGENIVLTLLTRSDLEGADALLPIISHNLKEIGLDLRIERADLSTWLVQIQQDRFDMALFRATPWGMVMDAGCAVGYFDSRRKGNGVLANVDDPAFHALCDQVLETVEPSVRHRLYHEIQRYYANNLPAVALCWAVNTYPALNRWQGLTINQIEGGLINRQTFTNLRRTP